MSCSTLPGPTDGSWLTSPDKYKRCFRRHGFQQMIHERRIDHGGFIDDEGAADKRVELIFFKAAALRIVLEQAMNGFCLDAGRFRHALCSAARGAASSTAACMRGKKLQHRPDDGCFSRAGPAGYDKNFFSRRQAARPRAAAGQAADAGFSAAASRSLSGLAAARREAGIAVRAFSRAAMPVSQV